MEQSSVHEVNQQESLSCSLQWLAGLIDSEGSIIANQFCQTGLTVRLYIANCDSLIQPLIVQVCGTLGLKPTLGHYETNGGNCRDSYATYVSGYEDMYNLLSHVVGFLCGKKEIAQSCIQLCKSRIENYHRTFTNEEQSLIAKIKRLNAKGQNPQRPYAEQEEFLMIRSGLNGDIESVAEMTTPSLHWLGGFLDGDGWITLDVNSNHTSLGPNIGFANTNPKNILAIMSVLKCNGFPFHVRSNDKKLEKHKLQYKISILGYKRCAKLVSVLRNYVRLKKRHADLLHLFVQSRLSKIKNQSYSNEEMNWFNAIKKLNQKGKVTKNTSKHAG